MRDKPRITIAVYCNCKILPSYYCTVNKDRHWLYTMPKIKIAITAEANVTELRQLSIIGISIS